MSCYVAGVRRLLYCRYTILSQSDWACGALLNDIAKSNFRRDGYLACCPGIVRVGGKDWEETRRVPFLIPTEPPVSLGQACGLKELFETDQTFDEPGFLT